MLVPEINTRHKVKTNFKFRLKAIRLKTLKTDKAIWLTDIWSTNYFHWFTDTLPRLLLAEKHYPEIPIIIPAYFNGFPYIIESLKAFPNTKILWLRNYQKYKVKELTYIPHTAPTGNYNEELIQEVGQKLSLHFGLNKITPLHKTMISRQAAPSRKITNHSELNQILQQNNIDDVVFEHKSWAGQIKSAAKAKLLIGTHGAGLTNMLFMQPGTSVLELRRKDDDKNNCYFSLASALNLNYYYLLCEVDDYTKLTQQNNFMVDTELFVKTIDSIK